MGRDKASLTLGATTLATRVASVLRDVTDTAIEVGPGRSGLPNIVERPPGTGPLTAIAAGWGHLVATTERRCPVLVLACDLPDVTVSLLRWLADYPDERPAGDRTARCSVVPVVGGQSQPLCARWSVVDLDLTRTLVTRGERSLRHVFGESARYPAEDEWSRVAAPSAFVDLDTPEDLKDRLRRGAPP